jgi:hypothetical protein
MLQMQRIGQCVKVMRNSIDSDNAKASDRSNDHDYAYASDNAYDKIRRVVIMWMLMLMIMLKWQGSG